jgi:hypothetical protein
MIQKLSVIINTLGLCSILLVVLMIAALNVPDRELPEEPVFGCGMIDSYYDNHIILTDLKGYQIFNQNCMACHGVYKRIIGPGLATVAGRRDSLWITQWIQDNELLRSKDQIAQELYLEYNETQCLKNDFSKTDMSDLMTFLHEQNKVSK